MHLGMNGFPKLPLLCVLVVSACGTKAPAPTGPSYTPGVAVIGVDGGVVQLDTLVTVAVPPRALASDTTLTIEAIDGEADGYVLASKRYRFKPEGLKFADEVIVTFEQEIEANGNKIHWSKEDGSAGYDVLRTNECGANANGAPVFCAKAKHFSDGFLGTKQLKPTVCAAGQTQCAAACVDLQTSKTSCGVCGNACAENQTCAAGVCI